MEIVMYSVEELAYLFASSVPVGILIGCTPMLIGFVIQALVNITKRGV